MQTNAFRTMTVLIVLTMVAALIPIATVVASDADVTLTTVLRQEEPITLYGASSSNISTLDPQRADDTISIDVLENLFLGLTDTDPFTPGAVNEEIATAWSVSDDGLVWTFTLRDDVPWVRYNPATDEVEKLRNVTAQDFVNGFHRACDPRLSSYYQFLASQMIEGCNNVMNTDVAEITDEDFEQVAARALDDQTLEVTLQFPAGYFFSQSPMWIYRAIPIEAIEEYGDDWTEVGNIVTNGPFVITEWIVGVRRVFKRNPYIPEDMIGPGNVERIITTVVEDQTTRFALYMDKQIEGTSIPAAEMQRVVTSSEFEGQLYRVNDLGVRYIGFVHDKAPFDNVQVRRAFYASVDQQAFINEVRAGEGIPMIHFTPPGMFGAPPINEVGVGYNPEWAREQLAEAGYPECTDFPNIEMVAYAGEGGKWGEYLEASIERELGCSNVLDVQTQEFSVLLQTTDAENPPEDRPHLFTLGWGPDYPDANNFVNEVLYCEGENRVARPCTEVDDLIIEAAREPDPESRIEMYYRIEEMFFGPDGEFPMIPLYMGLFNQLHQTWYDAPFETDGIIGGGHWDYRSIDQEAQLAARNG